MREQVEIEDHVALYMSVSPFSGNNHRDPAYRAIRTSRHTFVRTSEEVYYLFDDVNDPYQLNNLAERAEAADLRKELERQLTRQLAKIDDTFREKEYYLEKWGYEVTEQGHVPYSR